MAFTGKNIPKKGSAQWIKNEKIIAKNPFLRGERDKSEGFKPSSGIVSADNSQAYKDGWERIFGKKNKNYKVEQAKLTDLNWDGNNESE